LWLHEYIDDLEVLRDALNAGHDFVITLLATTDRMIGHWQQVTSKFECWLGSNRHQATTVK